ncbi:S9 family peptidase [Pedobacter metabolipauper]|uniref:Dipeptidyl aminopeptidase/acylaminoacyl peptidase n=1 Tax=Pedobacter metabolipauper TaxID=425513 RepID=A0A4R6SRA3_9SPHI|nr:S9 family peptidase [Pedobacter metabolipauper]TDQ06632.1 dipeptidyl aminopeptidase/acylaminoacyl peptidase [Pedobacter metabolipauper]
MKHFFLILLCTWSASLYAQQNYKPAHQELLNSYKRAAAMDTTVTKLITRSAVRANWAADGKTFWYRVNLPGNKAEYIQVDVAARTKAIIAEPKLPVPAQRSNDRYPRRNYDQGRAESPDKKYTALIKEGNIYVQSQASQEETPLTKDGTIAKPYGRMSWSPDSKTLVGYKTDPKETEKVYYLLSAVPGTTRAELKSNPYMQPGEDFTSFEMFLFNMENKTSKRVETDKIDFFGTPQLHWRKNDNTYFTFERRDRGHQRFRVIEVNTKTAQTKNIIDEKTNTFIYEQRIFTQYLPETHELIWTTEKDGYRHLYLVDERTGKEKRITKGNWVVRNIDSVDLIKREIWFRASGMDPAEDPYNIHYYRIGFDGRKTIDLTPATGNHNLSYSPDKTHFLDTYSQVNVAPVTTLTRTADGKKIMDVEKADLSAFSASGIRLPEVFVAKGRDGTTDIWGIMCRPSQLDSTRTYPVIEYIYAGPQDSFVPKTFMPYSEMQSLAELGFIVVQCDGMGTANRSKAFHDVCWKNLADAGFEDRILWIKALAGKYSYLDISKVGIYGTSAGGQNAGGAVLFHPEFYTSAVAACGCHDNRVDKQWWNEQWMGYPVGPHYEAQSNITNAAKLKGNLMLLVGEADTNVPPESTYRYADALIKAGKTFELIVVPGMGHSDGGPFGKNKKRDFFVKTLLGVDPPNRNIGELNP